MDGWNAAESAWLLDLRSRAEASLSKMESEAGPLHHEWRLHQIEIEMQNEELRRSQVALEASRDRYRALLAAAPLGYLVLDDRGRIGEVSPQGARLLGASEADLLHRHVQAFLLPVDADALHLHLVACLSTGQAQPFDVALAGTGPECRRVRLQMVKSPGGSEGLKAECWVFMMDLSMPESSAPIDARERVIVPDEIATEGAEQEVVLLVDDESILRKAVSRMLESAGYRVISVASAAEALAVASRDGQRIDLLITDVRMPGMNGGELGERMAILRPDVPRLYVSGHVGDVKLEEGAEVLVKPLPPGALLAIVANRLSKR